MSFTLRYHEHRPPSDISPWVACIWQMAGQVAVGKSIPHRILPDGCTDLVFDLDSARHGGDTPDSVVGPMSRANTVRLCDAIEMVGIRLRPGAFGTVSGIPAGELLDSSIALEDVVHSLRICSAGQLAACVDSAAQFALLTAACRRAFGSTNGPDPAIDFALTQWSRAEAPAFPTVSVMVRAIGLSERAFERRFVARVGLTPVQYRRLARFRGVLRLHSQGVQDWATLAAMTGYSDQSHLVRDFGAFAGVTPTAWAASQGDAGFLQDGAMATL